MIKPTRGRVVLFTPGSADGIIRDENPLAAIIAHVHADDVVNLTVLDPFGRVHSRQGVPLLGDDAAIRPKEGPYAEWMPYQKGQAAKTEQVEADLQHALSRSAAPAQQTSTGNPEAQGSPAEGHWGTTDDDDSANAGLLNFGEAIALLKLGATVARAGWNGRGMFLFLVPGSTFTVNRPPLLGIYPEGTEVSYHAHIDMKTAQGEGVPWLASQTDVLAEDWVVVE